MFRDMVNKNDPVAKKVLAYQDSKEFKKELDLLAERVRPGLSLSRFLDYEQGNSINYMGYEDIIKKLELLKLTSEEGK